MENNGTNLRNLVWQLTKVRNKKEVIDEARNKGISVISRILNWSLNIKKYKGRVVLRGDIVKDDAGSYAVFTEQGSSASQMTTAKVMDIISRLPGCSGQAADAISACTQVKMEDAPTLSKTPVRVSRYKDTSVRTQIAKILVQCGRPNCSS